MDREALLERLKEPFDLLVLGGGATGAGVLWEATLRGLKADLAGGGGCASGPGDGEAGAGSPGVG